MSRTAGTVPALRGRLRVPSDKAISHRGALLAALSRGRSRISDFSPAGDCVSSLDLVVALGCRVHRSGSAVEIDGLGPSPRLGEAEVALDCGRSGTTMRLAAGLLAGWGARARLGGDPQLLNRPMERVAEPLRLMGARVRTGPGGRPPLRLGGGELTGIHYLPPIASAQVKSALLIAGLGAQGVTTVLEPIPTRDHTERLLAAMGAEIQTRELAPGRAVSVRRSALGPLNLDVPGDASSAAVLATAAALVPGSELVLEGVSVNPGRSGFLALLRRMGAGVEELVRSDEGPEPSADLRISQAPLRAVTVLPDEVPSMIDELPLLGLLATAAEGTTRVSGAAELRVKESDRISGLITGLRRLGASAEELPDGFLVEGPSQLRGASCDSLADHRLAMTFLVAGLVADGPVEVSDSEFIADSFPGFQALLRGIL